MQRVFEAQSHWLLAGALAVSCFVGCGKPSLGQYVPAEEPARKALEAALNHWREGHSPGTVTSISPPVEVVDSLWNAGQKLAGFEIVNQESVDGILWFTVRLTRPDSEKEQEVRYAVVGKSALWVFREEDYRKMSGMGK
jgi:hypothetical protein